MPALDVHAVGTNHLRSTPTMHSVTHIQAGLPAAGVARHGAVAAAAVAPAALVKLPQLPQGVYGSHQSATWTKGAIAKPATFMVLDGKNRPTRPLPECSP
jgi:hypothetical protein